MKAVRIHEFGGPEVLRYEDISEPQLRKDQQEQVAVFGDDPYPLGLRAMGKNVERAVQGSLEQGLLTKALRLEDIYYRSTLNT